MNLETIKNYVLSSKTWIIILALMGFIAIAIYIFQEYMSPSMNPEYVENNEFISSENQNKNYADLYLFRANWCPYSKKIVPIWNELKDKYNNKTINNYTVVFKNIEEKQNADLLADFEKTYSKEVDGFPTIILIKDTQVVEFEAKPTFENLEQFLESILI